MSRVTREPALAFLGCGGAAERHARVLGRVGGAVPVHFASRDPGRAERFRDRLGGVAAYGSYQEALETPEVTVAVVTTPPDSHRELTLAALEAGKDVVVEKPAFPDPGSFGAVRAAARERGRMVLVAENYYYKPIRRRVAELLGEGVVGEPLLVRVNAVKWQDPTGWRAQGERIGGGGLLEGGIHWVNLVSNLGLEVRGVRGFRALGGADPRGVAETLEVVFDLAPGCVGSLSFSWEVPSPLRGLRLSTIHGTEGSLWFESNGLMCAAWGRRRHLSFPGLRDLGGYRAMWRDFLRALRERSAPSMTLEMAERDVELVRMAYSGQGQTDPPDGTLT